MKNIMIAQSGGPTAAINTSLAGLLDAAFESDQVGEVYGGIHGIQGIIEGNVISLTERLKGKKDKLDKLYYTPDMYLRTCRYKLKKPEDDSTDYEKVLETFKKYDIDIFLYIGGNDSMDTVARMSEFVKARGEDIKVVGVPKTVDNDLVEIDHTPGFGSAAKYVATSVREIMLDTCIYPYANVAIVEIMGRDAGWLTAAASLSAPDGCSARPLVYLPESAFDEDKFIEKVNEGIKSHGYVVVAVSEGIRDKDGNYISASETKLDKFGHPQLSGTGSVLVSLVKERIGCKVRGIELATAQRSAGHCASATDLAESFKLGQNACRYALEGKTGVMACLKRTSNKPYETEFSAADVLNIANKVKGVPAEWIDEENAFVTQEMIDYLTPLIQGETEVTYKNGLPDYLFEEV